MLERLDVHNAALRFARYLDRGGLEHVGVFCAAASLVMLVTAVCARSLACVGDAEREHHLAFSRGGWCA